jgi:hypothetical protein
MMTRNFVGNFLRTAFAIGAILLGTTSIAATLEEAGNTAQMYMTAFLRRDFATAAKLLDPAVLLAVKKTFVLKLDEANANGLEAGFLAMMGCKSREEFLSLSPAEVYVRSLESARKKEVAPLGVTKQAVVKVVSTESAGPSKARVRLSMSTAEGTGLHTQEGVFLLRERSDGWKVLGDGRQLKKTNSSAPVNGSGRTQ